jgi:hypothetical protein
MGISYYNSSGYPDPTAHYAVRNMEEEEKMLHIVYPTGHMDIRMDKFFPCTLDRARKLFRLMAQYSPAEDQHRLFGYLRQREEKFKSQVETYSRQAAEATKRHEVSKYESFARNAENQRHRTKRNIELLCQICRMGVSK